MVARWLGVAAPGLAANLSGYDQFAAAVGRKPTVATFYEHWAWNRAFPTAELDGVRLRGATPQVTWEPWDGALGPTQPKYRVRDIANGAYDTYLTGWAQGAVAWGKPLRIRLAHEMNYGSYPWVVGRNGTTPDDHIRMWLHVRGVFAAAGATNVTWVWSINNVFPGTAPLAALYPGDIAVDEIAVDGYNPAPWGSPWTSFAGVFKRSIAELTPMTSRPITIGETGCPEVGGDKAAWIRDMWATLATAEYKVVRGLLWFNFNKEANWTVDSSPASLAAFKAGLPGFLAE
jgi:beta-mannanase